jgi:hypothetical protein
MDWSYIWPLSSIVSDHHLHSYWFIIDYLSSVASTSRKTEKHQGSKISEDAIWWKSAFLCTPILDQSKNERDTQTRMALILEIRGWLWMGVSRQMVYWRILDLEISQLTQYLWHRWTQVFSSPIQTEWSFWRILHESWTENPVLFSWRKGVSCFARPRRVWTWLS